MNLLNKALLRLALLPGGLYRNMGVNTRQLRAILQTKLTLDDRRPNTIHQTNHRKKNSPVKAATVGTFFLSAFFGLLLLGAFQFGSNTVLQFTFYYTFFMLLLGATLISDFTSVLIDVRDTFIILPRPVNDRTFVLARILHISIHLSKIFIPMSLPAFGYLLIRHGPGGALVYLLMTVLATLFTISLINAFYLLILKVTTPQKFQSIISYIQIFFAMGIYGGSQLLPRMLEHMDGTGMSLSLSPLLALAPPYWFAAGWNTLHFFEGTTLEWTGAALSVGFTAASLYLVIKYLAPAFNNKLALMNSSGEPRKTPAGTRAGKGIFPFIGRLLTRAGAERMGFLFTLKMMGRSRDFRLKVYPSLGYFLIMILVMAYQLGGAGHMQVQSWKLGPLSLMAIYLSNLSVFMALNQVKYSEKYKAAWLFYSTPVAAPGAVILGSMKACLLLFYTPIAVCLSVALLLIRAPYQLPNLFLGLSNQLLIFSLVLYATSRKLPFSLPESEASKGETIMQNFLLLFCCGIVGGIHYLLSGFPLVLVLLTLLSMGATWLLTDSIRRTTWKELRQGSE
jgi:ABC-2 type transport system permease protein